MQEGESGGICFLNCFNFIEYLKLNRQSCIKFLFPSTYTIDMKFKTCGFNLQKRLIIMVFIMVELFCFFLLDTIVYQPINNTSMHGKILKYN